MAIGWSDLFEEGDRIFTDQAASWEWPVSVAYTPHGIRAIDGEFCVAIQTADTMEECRKIAKFLIACHNLHLVIRENLMLNLVNVMTSILNGKRVSKHDCTRVCFKDYKRICCKKGFNKLADRYGYIPKEIQ
jgi:hypothetical protein